MFLSGLMSIAGLFRTTPAPGDAQRKSEEALRRAAEHWHEVASEKNRMTHEDAQRLFAFGSIYRKAYCAPDGSIEYRTFDEIMDKNTIVSIETRGNGSVVTTSIIEGEVWTEETHTSGAAGNQGTKGMSQPASYDCEADRTAYLRYGTSWAGRHDPRPAARMALDAEYLWGIPASVVYKADAPRHDEVREPIPMKRHLLSTVSRPAMTLALISQALILRVIFDKPIKPRISP